MAKIKCFWVEPTERMARYLRCYASGDCKQSGIGYHNAQVRIEDDDAVRTTVNGHRVVRPAGGERLPNDHRWPTFCACGLEFDISNRQLFCDSIYFNPDTGESWPLRELPVGAVWNAEWLAELSEGRVNTLYTGPDGLSLHVRTPGGDWCIDGRANNCTMPEDNTHKCWVRHGSPKDGTLHVDKNGHTCGAGAGSIVQPGYHGFLHNGHLVDC